MSTATIRLMLSISLLGVVALIACQESIGPAAVDQSQLIASPRFAGENAPPMSGIVSRVTEGRIFGFTIGEPNEDFLVFDPDRLLIAIISPSDNRSFRNFGCEEHTEVLPVTVQVVDTPAGFKTVTVINPQFLFVYDVTGFPPLNCDLLTNATGRLLAEGVVKGASWVDNDINAESGHTNANLDWAMNGRLTNPQDGSELHARMLVKFLIHPKHGFVLNQVDVALNPDPRD